MSSTAPLQAQATRGQVSGVQTARKHHDGHAYGQCRHRRRRHRRGH
jgi:hypothetical protein